MSLAAAYLHVTDASSTDGATSALRALEEHMSSPEFAYEDLKDGHYGWMADFIVGAGKENSDIDLSALVSVLLECKTARGCILCKNVLQTNYDVGMLPFIRELEKQAPRIIWSTAVAYVMNALLDKIRDSKIWRAKDIETITRIVYSEDE